MSITRSLLKVGALYAAGRFVSNLKASDVERVSGLTQEDLKRFGLDRADALLDAVGLRRESTVPNATAMVLSGFAAGALVGAGMTFLFYSEQGKEVRAKVLEFFADRDAATDEGDADEPSAAEPENHGANGMAAEPEGHGANGASTA